MEALCGGKSGKFLQFRLISLRRTDCRQEFDRMPTFHAREEARSGKDKSTERMEFYFQVVSIESSSYDLQCCGYTLPIREPIPDRRGNIPSSTVSELLILNAKLPGCMIFRRVCLQIGLPCQKGGVFRLH